MILAALLLAATPETAPSPSWLVGRWIVVSEASRQDAEACAGTDVKLWRHDGSFFDSFGEGEWSLRADRLLEADESGAYASRVRRLGRDRLQLTDADGELTDYRRCPRDPR